MIYNIYKITNIVNGKIYIGQTSYPIEKRFKEHINKVKYETNIIRPLYLAMRKYGVENFQIELIEKVKTKKLTNIREKFWIEFYNSYKGDGYNATEGGDGGSSQQKTVLQIDKNNYKIVNTFNSTHDAGKHLGKKNAKISNACLKQCVAYGYLWIYKDDYDQIKTSLKEHFSNGFKTKTKQVLQLDKNTDEIICQFASIKEAANETGFVAKRIHRVCHGDRKTYKGFVWKYKEDYLAV